jgi:hypothetical protein
MEDQSCTSRYSDVHMKALALRDRVRQTSNNHAQVQERKSLQEAKEMKIIDAKLASAR